MKRSGLFNQLLLIVDDRNWLDERYDTRIENFEKVTYGKSR